MILSMDFASTLLGGIEALGCKFTQKGVLCQKSSSLSLSKEHVMLSSPQGVTITGSFKVKDTEIDKDFLSFFIKRDYKYLQDNEKHTVTETPSRMLPFISFIVFLIC